MSQVFLIGMDKKEAQLLKKIFGSVRVETENLSMEEALVKIPEYPPAFVLTKDPENPESIHTLSAMLKKESPSTPFAVQLKKSDMDHAMELMRSGAVDCFEPHLTRLDVLAVAKRATAKMGRTLIVPKVEKPKRRMSQILIGVLVFVFMTSLVIDHLHGPPANTLKLDSKFLSGIQWQDPYLWVGDWFNATVTKFKVGPGMTKKGRVLSTDSLFRMKDGQPILVSQTSEALVTVGTDLKLRSHKWEVGLPTLQTIQTPGTNPTGLAWDGAHLWLTDFNTGLLYRYDRFFRVLDTHKSLVPKPIGLAWDDGSLWVLGTEPLQLARMERLGRGVVWRGPYILSDWIPKDKNITGMAVQYGRLWLTIEGDGRMISKPLKTIFEKSIPWVERYTEEMKELEKDEKAKEEKK